MTQAWILIGVVGACTIAVQATIGILSWVAPSVLPAQWLGRAGERTVGTLGGPVATHIGGEARSAARAVA